MYCANRGIKNKQKVPYVKTETCNFAVVDSDNDSYKKNFFKNISLRGGHVLKD